MQQMCFSNKNESEKLAVVIIKLLRFFRIMPSNLHLSSQFTRHIECVFVRGHFLDNKSGTILSEYPFTGR